MQLPRRSVRSIQELPSIYTAFPPHYKPVRTHSASTASESARSPDIEDGLEVVPLEHQSAHSAPIVSAYLDEKEVFIATYAQTALEKPLPNIPKSVWSRTWNRMSVKSRVFAVLGLQAAILLTIGITLLAASPKPQDNHTESRRTGDNSTEISTLTSIKRGTFTVPMLFPQQQSSKCLARGNESRAWQCAFDTKLQLSILPSPSADAAEPVMITLGLPSISNRSVHCGQQAPEIGPTAMTAINGSNDGSQYHFSSTYDRVVILGADQLGQEKTTPSPMQGQSKHTTFLPGQSVWRCTFPNTRLEGFIYPRRERDPASNVTDPVPAASAQLPYSLKLLEQRSVDGSAPYCEKVVVGSGGSLQGSNEKVDLELSETQVGSKDEADTSCQCQWVVE